MKRIALLVALYFSVVNMDVYARKIETDISACKGVLIIFEQLKAGLPKPQIELTIDSVLQTKAYRVMFQHYNRDWRPNHLPENVFKRMILSLRFPGEYTPGENERADAMLKFWKRNFENLDDFKRNIQMLGKANLGVLIQKGVSSAQNWLPQSMKIPDFYFFVHPNGGSPAFAINGNQGYDFFQLERNPDGTINVQALIDVIAHESHHLGLKIAGQEFRTGKDSLAFSFLQIFVAEGTASKFVDNMPGGTIGKVGKGRSKNFEEAVRKIWSEYSLQEEEMFRVFEEDFRKIYDGTYTKDSIQSRMLHYWLSGGKGRAYFLGSELFGAIYQAFGRQQLFYTMENPRYLLRNYNNAINKLGKKLKKKILLSEWLTKVL